MKAPFVPDPALTSIAIAYQPTGLIAEAVLPRSTVTTREFRYTEYNRDERFTIPDTFVGRRGRTNQVEFGATEKAGIVEDYALEDPIPQRDLDNAANHPNIDPEGQATEGLQWLIALSREKRVADLVFDPATYPTGRKVTLAGTSQWTDTTNSDPIDDILAALDAPLLRPNMLVFGQQAWRTLSVHPKIAKAVHGNSGDTAIARRAQIAELFEVSEIHVGQGWLNTANKGQAANFARVWGDSVAALHKSPSPTPRQTVTFGLTFQHGDRFGGRIADPDIGAKGGVRIRTGESLVERIIAADVGYLINDVAA